MIWDGFGHAKTMKQLVNLVLSTKKEIQKL